VIVGDVPYQDAYANKIKSYKDDRLVFTGYITNSDELASLYKYCFAYMHGHEFGGTNPTLLKAMANGCAIGAIDTVFSREVLQNDSFGTYFKKDIHSLMHWFQWAESNQDKFTELRATVSKGLNEKYNWELVTDLYLYHINALIKKSELNEIES
jgi:glycosyltransferase involved in cell wall biosynthesis